MKMKKLLSKMLLVAMGLCAGSMSVWGNDTFGALDQGWWINFSQTYTLEGYGKYHFQFTTTNPADGEVYKTWLLVATNGADSHGGGGTEYFAWRGDGYAWGQGKNSNPYDEANNAAGDPEHLVCSNTYATANPTGAGLMSAMNGATVDMVITRTSTNIYAEATVTPTEENPFTMSFSYLYGNATSDNIGLFFEVQNSTMDISTAENYYNITRYSQDYEDATNWNAGWDNYGSQADGNGGKVFYVGGLNNSKTCTLSFATNDYFKNASDYVFSFQFAFSNGNGGAGASSLVVKDIEGNALFTFSNDGNWDDKSDITYGETTVKDVYTSPYNNSACGPYATFTLVGNTTEGLVLSVSSPVVSTAQGGNKANIDAGVTKAIHSVRIGNFAKVGSIVLTTAKSATHSGIDNMILKEHSDVAVALDPTYAFKSVSGDNRVYTIENPNGEGTLYYTTATAAEAPAVGDAAYTSTTEASVDVTFATGTYYAYAVLSDGTTTSAIVSQQVTGGAITLNTPTWTKTTYNAETSTSTVTLTSNQSGKLGSPTADIYYRINDGDATQYTEPISVIDGQKLSYYASATGYTTSAEGNVTATAPCSDPNLRAVETYYRASDGGISVNTEEAAAATIGETTYRYMYCDNNHVSEYLVTSSSGLSNWMLRTGGIYAGQPAAYAIMGVKENDYITITFGAGTESPVPTTSNGTKDEWNSTSTSFAFKVTSTNGYFRFNFARYGYIKTIKIQRAPTATITSAGYATFSSPYALDFTGLDVKAYTASLKDDKGEKLVLFSPVTKIPANTGVLLKGEEGTYEIPVIASADAIAGNLLKASADEDIAASTEGIYHYVLASGSNGVGFYNLAAAKNIGVGKAYLETTEKLKYVGPKTTKSFWLFADDDMTGIETVKAVQTENKAVYNLNGQRLVTPKKGVNIIGGKLMIMK